MGANELVGIELQLKGYDAVMSDMRMLDQLLNGLRGKRNRIAIETDLKQAKKELIAYSSEVDGLKAKMKGLSKYLATPNGLKLNPQWDDLNSKLQKAQENLKTTKQRVTELQYALKNMTSMSFMQAFNKLSSMTAHLGSAMQSAGNALTKLTSPFQRFTSGIVMGAGYKALSKFTEGLNNGFNRYDTMKKYPKIMAAFGYSNEQSEKSVNALDKSVRGLPTGLDEMVDMAQRFTATTNDIDKGTKLAIASNNAFLASMSTDTQKYQGMMQLQDVLGGKDMNAREWNSLVSSMTPAIVKMGEAMKESGEWSGSIGDFIQHVRDGKMDNQEFIDQLIKIGNEGGTLEKMAQESKNTWQAFFANVGNAASRMTAGVIQALDEVSQIMTGKDVNQLLSETIIPAIDNMTESIKGWIKAHPQEITDFFKSLKSINWQSILKGVGEGIMSVADTVKRFADLFGGRDLSRIGRWMIKGNILGKALTIFGGLIKGSRGIVALIGASGASLFRTIRGIKKEGGLMGYLTKGLIGDNPTATGEALDTLGKTAPKMGKIGTGLSKLFTGWAEIATMVGGSALVAWGSVKLFKGAFKDIKEIGEIVGEIDWGTATPALLGMVDFITALIGVGNIIGKLPANVKKDLGIGTLIAGGMTLFASGTFWADMAMIKRGFKAIADTTQYLNDAIKNLGKLKSVESVGRTR